MFHEPTGQLLGQCGGGEFLCPTEKRTVYLRRFQTRQEAKTEIFEYLEGFYNRQRRHSTLGYLSPVEFEERTGLVKYRVH